MTGSNERPKRGRPSGKNRVPLTAKERRARNALYERERRQQLEHELIELARVVGCDREVTPDSKLLRIAFQTIKRSKDVVSDVTKEKLEEQNRMLEHEIAKLEEQIQIERIKDWLLEPPTAVLTNSDSQEEEKNKTGKELVKSEEDDRFEHIEEWLLESF